MLNGKPGKKENVLVLLFRFIIYAGSIIENVNIQIFAFTSSYNLLIEILTKFEI